MSGCGLLTHCWRASVRRALIRTWGPPAADLIDDRLLMLPIIKSSFLPIHGPDWHAASKVAADAAISLTMNWRADKRPLITTIPSGATPISTSWTAVSATVACITRWLWQRKEWKPVIATYVFHSFEWWSAGNRTICQVPYFNGHSATLSIDVHCFESSVRLICQLSPAPSELLPFHSIQLRGMACSAP